MPGPVQKAFRFTGDRDENRAAAVARLGIKAGPSAVFGCVTKLVVDPVYTEGRARALAHVIQESLKVCQPSIADTYALSSVGVKRPAARVGAAAHHAQPNAMLSAAGLPLAALEACSVFPSRAAARLGSSASYLGAGNNDFIPAIAFRKPARSVIMDRVKSDNCQFAELESGDIELTWHNANVASTFASINADVGGLPC